MIDTTACNSPKITSQVLKINTLQLSANFSIPDSICLGTAMTPTLTTSNVTFTNWTFGDGNSSVLMPPTYTYDSTGLFTVILIAGNPGACNGPDTFYRQIKVLPNPTANFTYLPILPVANEPTSFTNLSVNATRYLWDFADNTTSTDVNPVHQFNYTGFFKTCLTAYNNSNCPSRICKTVQAEVTPIIGLPTGFSPNGDGENDILYVRGAAILTLDLKIYNRWGQLVFETKNQENGWDGTFNGQPQPIDAYAYVLVASFIDGTNKTLKGNITLLR